MCHVLKKPCITPSNVQCHIAPLDGELPWSLQKNQIQTITGLETLGSLQKLYLEDNEIACVENLESCTSLQELHLSRQRLPADKPLAFSSSCLEVHAGFSSCYTQQCQLPFYTHKKSYPMDLVKPGWHKPGCGDLPQNRQQASITGL